MTKPALLSFAKLRSYPLRQLHHLAAALHERDLPLAAPAVASLIKMATYQLGELSSPAARVWREGWEHDTLPALLEVRGSAHTAWTRCVGCHCEQPVGVLAPLMPAACIPCAARRLQSIAPHTNGQQAPKVLSPRDLQP